MVADTGKDGSKSGDFGSEGRERGSGARRKKAMKASIAHASLLLDGQLPRQREEADTPTSNQPPCVDRGRRLLGPQCSALDLWLRLEAKPERALGPGLLSVFWERGSPDLPTCGLRRGSRGGPAWPIFINTSSTPSRGAKPRGADDRRLPQARPRQAGSRGGGEIKAGYLTRCP